MEAAPRAWAVLKPSGASWDSRLPGQAAGALPQCKAVFRRNPVGSKQLFVLSHCDLETPRLQAGLWVMGLPGPAVWPVCRCPAPGGAWDLHSAPVSRHGSGRAPPVCPWAKSPKGSQAGRDLPDFPLNPKPSCSELLGGLEV